MTDREMSPSDLAESGRAKRLLENQSFTARVAELIGAPVEKAMASLPETARAAYDRLPR